MHLKNELEYFYYKTSQELPFFLCSAKRNSSIKMKPKMQLLASHFRCDMYASRSYFIMCNTVKMRNTML